MSQRKKILTGVAVGLLLLVLIIYLPSFFPERKEESAPQFSILSPEEQARLEEVRKLKNLSFDVGLFKDPIFESLQDIQMPKAVIEPAGRPNPFLPF